MYVCYIDEAGCTGQLPTATSPVQPLLVIGAVIVEESDLQSLTYSFLDLKERYFRPLMPIGRPPQDQILVEIKGADLRRDVRSGNRTARRRAIGFLDHLLKMLADHHARIVARVWIKPIGGPVNRTSIYTSSIQAICEYFQDFLTTTSNQRGIVIADGRSKAKNINVAHSVFTQKFQQAGDRFNRILEMPTFGNSDNHAGLQLTDLLCSALLFPIAAYSYCLGHVNSVHVDPGYARLKQHFGEKLLQLQYRYQDENDRWRGGVTVSDAIGQRPGILMFR